MTIDEEIKFMQELELKIHNKVSITYDSMFHCEENVEELLKIAPFIFSKENFFSLVYDYTRLDKVSGRFENAVANMSHPVTIEDAMDIEDSIQAISVMFGVMSKWIRQANEIIQNKQFDVNKMLLVERIKSVTGLEYDTIAYDELEGAFEHMFLVVQVKDSFDLGDKYGSLNVLSIKSFKTRVEANMYALANGISRDYIITRFWGEDDGKESGV